MLKKVLKIVAIIAISLTYIFAKGTLANTVISNIAKVNYTLGGIENNITSNANSFVVDKIVDIVLVWQDNAPVEVGSGEHNRVLKFNLTNLGNSTDDVNISYEHNSTSDFVPLNPTIHLDSNGDGIYDPSVDLAINDINLSADANATLFVVCDIPNDANESNISRDGIEATSNTSATAGADHPNQVDTVVRKGADRAEGIYKVRDYFLISSKSAKIHSDDNATHTGTIITYTIDLGIGGNSAGKSITNIKLKDNIPVGTRYQAGSLRLDDANLSDPADSDAGSFDGSVVYVNVGTISGAVHKKVKFDVQVQ